MKKIWLSLLALCSTSLLYTHTANACTDFTITAKDGTAMVTRSMEFAPDLQSNIRTSTRNRAFTGTLPNGKPGMAWTAKYGYVYLDGMQQDFAIDGMNETGLTFEYLYLPGNTQYQIVPDGKEKQGVSYIALGDWVLSNFKSVDEVRQAIASIYVYQQTLPGLGDMVFPLHAAIHDATGKGIVVEFNQGKINVFDYVGVMTNSPTYDWHVSNLKNYLNLSPYSPSPMTINGITYTVNGQGSGMLGLPGDIAPPSRFVKISFLAKNAYPVNDALSALNLSQHIINNVDIPSGLARSNINGKETSELTQWVVIKDMTNKIFYYRTYNDMTIRAVNFSKLDFAPTAIRLKMPISTAPYVMDVTGNFLAAK